MRKLLVFVLIVHALFSEPQDLNPGFDALLDETVTPSDQPTDSGSNPLSVEQESGQMQALQTASRPSTQRASSTFLVPLDTIGDNNGDGISLARIDGKNTRTLTDGTCFGMSYFTQQWFGRVIMPKLSSSTGEATSIPVTAANILDGVGRVIKAMSTMASDRLSSCAQNPDACRLRNLWQDKRVEAPLRSGLAVHQDDQDQSDKSPSRNMFREVDFAENPRPTLAKVEAEIQSFGSALMHWQIVDFKCQDKVGDPGKDCFSDGDGHAYLAIRSETLGEGTSSEVRLYLADPNYNLRVASEDSEEDTTSQASFPEPEEQYLSVFLDSGRIAFSPKLVAEYREGADSGAHGSAFQYTLVSAGDGKFTTAPSAFVDYRLMRVGMYESTLNSDSRARMAVSNSMFKQSRLLDHARYAKEIKESSCQSLRQQLRRDEFFRFYYRERIKGVLSEEEEPECKSNLLARRSSR